MRPTLMRKRTLARELALQALYELDVRDARDLSRLDEFLAEYAEDEDVAGFARDLVAGTWEHRAQIDARIEKVARNWELRRMAVVDRNILRLAAFELLHREDIPPLVSINEAIEMAKKFSTRNSGPFVNGILDNLRTKETASG